MSAFGAQGAAVLLDRAGFVYASEEDAAPPAPMWGSRVDDICLSVAPGTCTVLCGRSGDGKSTVLRMIDGLAGTFYPGERSGAVAVCGTEVRELAARERTERMGVVLQDPRSQFFMATVADEIAFSAENLGVPPAEVVRRVGRVAEVAGVGHLLGERLSELSSGQKQRVAIAAALVCDPSVLVLDEPLANLDEEGSRGLVALVGRLCERGCAVVVSEHRLHRLLPVATEYVYLREGRVAHRWTPEAFRALDEREARRLGLRHPGMAADGAFPAPFSAGDDAEPWRVEGLSYRYPATGRGVAGVSAAFPHGAVTVVAGANGAGKTTLAKVLCGAVREQEGGVFLGARRLSRKERRRRSYFVMQDADYQLYAGSVADEVVFGRRVDDALARRAREALAAFDLTDLAERHPASLSGGQKQRVTLAAAYCSDADLVVLDEPTSGLDGRGVAEVAAWAGRLARAGKAVAIITHDELLARLVQGRVVRIEGKGNPWESKA